MIVNFACRRNLRRRMTRFGIDSATYWSGNLACGGKNCVVKPDLSKTWDSDPLLDPLED